MKLQPITTNQFIWWLIASSCAVTLWILVPELIAVAGAAFGLSSLIILTSDRCRLLDHPQPVNDKAQNLSGFGYGWLLVIIVLFVGALSIFSPEQLLGFIKHPGFILPFWFVCTWLAFRRWQLGRPQRNPAPPAKTQS